MEASVLEWKWVLLYSHPASPILRQIYNRCILVHVSFSILGQIKQEYQL